MSPVDWYAPGRARGAVRHLSRRALLAALGALTCGCARLPTSGAVHTATVPGADPDSLVQTAPGPTEGAGPELIVTGFLRACTAGFSDDFATARSFLLPDVAARWSPRDLVRVYQEADAPVVARAPDGSVSVSTTIIGTIAPSGAMTRAPLTHTETRFSLARDVAGQWRVAEPPEGTLLADSTVRLSYAARWLCFPSWDGRRLVPELRWVPSSCELERLVELAVAGPSDWLAQGVDSALPAGTTAEVSQSGQVVTVRLTGTGSALEGARGDLAVAQLRETLLQVSSVSSVRVLAEDRDLGSGASLQAVLRAPGDVLGMSGGDVVRGTGTARTVLARAQVLGSASGRWPFLGQDGRLTVVSGPSLVQVPSGAGSASVILSAGTGAGGGLTAPVADRAGWVWTAEDGVLVAVDAAGLRAPLTAAWLQGRTVLAVDVSAEGERLVVHHRGEDQDQVDVAVIVRDASGRPTALGRALALLPEGAPTVLGAPCWYDPVNVALLLPAQDEGGAPRIHHLQVGGLSSDQTGALGATQVAANRVDGTLSLTDASQQVWQRSGATWRVVDTDLTDLSYPLP